MIARRWSFRLVLVVISLFSFLPAYPYIGKSWQNERPPLSAFDPGPEYPKNKDLIDLHSSIPFFPAISEALMEGEFSVRENRGADEWKVRPTQKFRPAFGPIPWRMILQPNNVKILFIGQDGTHIAEGAGRPATAGFGGRAQDLAAFFGVEYSAGFINTFAFTIEGQYGARFAPFVWNGEVNTSKTIIPNGMWLLAQDPSSPIVQWRNELIEWIINNNRESLKLIVLFGGSAQDSIATFIEANGGKVGAPFENQMTKIQVPLFQMAGSGGNGEFPYPVNRAGRDAYQALLGKNLDYANKDHQNEAMKYAQDNDARAIEEMVFSEAGPHKNGLVHPAQIGGFDLDQIFVDKNKTGRGMSTRSLKGLRMKSGTVQEDILVVALPHPTFLSGTLNETAIKYWEEALRNDSFYREALSKVRGGKVPDYKKLSFFEKDIFKKHPDQALAKKVSSEGYRKGKDAVADMVEKDVAKLREYAAKGWHIEADKSDATQKNVNTFAQGKKYDYGRSDIHSVFYDFGTPKNRMVSKSDARRGSHMQMVGNRKVSKGHQIIVLGVTEVPSYDQKKMDEMLKQNPNQRPDAGEMFVARPRSAEARYVFDAGPSVKYARLMKDFSEKDIFKTKPGMSFDKNGVDAYYVKNHPNVGDFGHYRGFFGEKPKVLILADPDGFDDLITARALTGTRGQYLQGMMEDLGLSDEYLVIKTVPFGMDKASDEDWAYVLKATEKYRKQLLQNILQDSQIDLILTDGPYAKKELGRILAELSSTVKNVPPVVAVNRSGTANNSGIVEAVSQIVQSVPAFRGAKASGRMRNIPRSHLSYYARIWEGTSGDRVLDSKGLTERGLAFQEVCPDWVVEQKPVLAQETNLALEEILQRLKDQGFQLPDEPVPAFVKRKGL